MTHSVSPTRQSGVSSWCTGPPLATPAVELNSVAGWLLPRFRSPLGAFVMAALHSATFFYLPLGIAAVVMILVARHATAPRLVPLIAPAGSGAVAATA